jgi:hypothetical protein
MADKIKRLDVIERGNLVCRAFKMTNEAVGEGVDLAEAHRLMEREMEQMTQVERSDALFNAALSDKMASIRWCEYFEVMVEELLDVSESNYLNFN